MPLTVKKGRSFKFFLLSFHRVQYGCTTVINIPAEDPDADSVRCRLAAPDECGDACTSAPNVTLNWVNKHTSPKPRVKEDCIKLTLNRGDVVRVDDKSHCNDKTHGGIMTKFKLITIVPLMTKVSLMTNAHY